MTYQAYNRPGPVSPVFIKRPYLYIKADGCWSLFQIILKVYLDAAASRVTEVPITPQTTVGDVLQCCKEPGEEQCHLAELWRGCGKLIFFLKI